MKERCFTQDKKKQSETQLGTSGLPHPYSPVGSPWGVIIIIIIIIVIIIYYYYNPLTFM